MSDQITIDTAEEGVWMPIVVLIPPQISQSGGGLAPTGVRIHPNLSKTVQTPAVAPEQINLRFFDATLCHGIFGRVNIL